MNNEKRQLDYYLDLPYTIVLKKDEDQDWMASVAELEGCIAHGDTQAEALAALEDVKKAWIEELLDSGETPPEPEESLDELPSGKWLQRVPRTLHFKLTEKAKKEEVSLNQFVTYVLAEAVGAGLVRRSRAEDHALSWAKAVTSISFDDWYPENIFLADWMVWDLTLATKAVPETKNLHLLVGKIPDSYEEKQIVKKSEEKHHGRFQII